MENITLEIKTLRDFVKAFHKVNKDEGGQESDTYYELLNYCKYMKINSAAKAEYRMLFRYIRKLFDEFAAHADHVGYLADGRPMWCSPISLVDEKNIDKRNPIEYTMGGMKICMYGFLSGNGESTFTIYAKKENKSYYDKLDYDVTINVPLQEILRKDVDGSIYELENNIHISLIKSGIIDMKMLMIFTLSIAAYIVVFHMINVESMVSNTNFKNKIMDTELVPVNE